MKSFDTPDLVLSAIGVTSAIGQGSTAFASALFAGQHAFAPMRRPGRTRIDADGETHFLGAEIANLSLPARITPRWARTASLTTQVAAATLDEAWHEARLDELDGTRIGLVVGGSNLQQRELIQTFEHHGGSSRYVRPSYASTFLDSDICGACSELYGIRGFAHSVGGASASGQLALIRAAQTVASGEVDVCIAMGALMDLSHWECQAMRSAGAMGSDRHADAPAAASRPFDSDRDGFIFGESCAVLVIERREHAARRGLSPYAVIEGWGLCSDAARGTAPSSRGELEAIRAALSHAHIDAAMIDYVNPHGTGSSLGDEIELGVLREAGLAHARINTTKSITGHGLTAAGAVELVACALQMRAGQLHPSRNLVQPLDPDMAWVGEHAESFALGRAINISIGFGGINTAVCLRHPELI